MIARPPNSSFSVSNEWMQTALDSTSLREFKTCPRKYYYSTVLGMVPRNSGPHLTFGILMHEAREQYEHCRTRNMSHDDALDSVVASTLEKTWDRDLRRGWASGHPAKNRRTLVQTIVWYLDAFGKDDPIETLQLANGKPAVELSFRFDSGLVTPDGEHVIFCGHLDRIGHLGAGTYIPDIKTSSSEPNAHFAQSFTPGTQFSLYTLAGKVAFDQSIDGVIVDGIQVGVGFARFGRHLIPRSDSQLEEFLSDTEMQIETMWRCAVTVHWPQNDMACGMYGGCPYRGVCSLPAAQREDWLRREFVQRVWDPLQIRGE